MDKQVLLYIQYPVISHNGKEKKCNLLLLLKKLNHPFKSYKEYTRYQSSQQHYSQQPKSGNNPNVHQLTKKKKKIWCIHTMEYYSTIKRTDSDTYYNTDDPKRHAKCNKVKSLSCVRLFATPWTVAYQEPQSMGFSRQKYWSELPFPSPRDLPKPGIEPRSPALQAGALPRHKKANIVFIPLI